MAEVSVDAEMRRSVGRSLAAAVQNVNSSSTLLQMGRQPQSMNVELDS